MRDRPRADDGPKLLLLDEPSAGLAPVIVRRCSSWSGSMRAEGYTVLIVEQNVRQVLKVVDRAYLLESGRIKAERHRRRSCWRATTIRKAYMGI